MVELINISKFELPNFVHLAYEEDEDLFEKYHIDKMCFNDCVDTTIIMIEETAKETSMQYYGVKFKDEIIGYLTTFPKFLYSFAININYRKKEILIGFWDKIKEVLGSSFICMLYPNNIRAINWLKKNGMIEVDGVEQNCVTLLNK